MFACLLLSKKPTADLKQALLASRGCGFSGKGVAFRKWVWENHPHLSSSLIHPVNFEGL